MNETNRINKLKCMKLAACVALCITMIISQSACSGKISQPVSAQGWYLNTSCTITIYDAGFTVNKQKLANAALEEIGRYEAIMSRTVKGSDVYRINNASGKYVKVCSDTTKVIKLGIAMGDETDGAFDITLGGISQMWDFSGKPKLPKDAAIKEHLPVTGYKSIEIKGNKVRMTDPQARMDLGAIAKGYIADRLTEYLEENGVTSAIIALSGNVAVIGEKAQDTPFVVGVERPYSDRTEIVGTIDANDMTLVTSGIYERCFKEGGKMYHHVLDPKTGYPADTDLESVTITADKGNSGLCDATSTACLLLGLDGARDLVESLQNKYPDIHMQASFIDRNDNISKTSGMNLKPKED